jgi:hypothetical protein
MERKASFSVGIFDRRVAMTALCLLGAFGLVGFAMITPAHAISREQDIVDLRLGQRVKVDDGTCPAGQIKEVSGTTMTESGVVRARKCIPRLGPKQQK